MKITGKNLLFVQGALRLARQELRNLIATCPDVNEHADAIDEIEAEIKALDMFAKRVDAAVERETGGVK